MADAASGSGAGGAGDDGKFDEELYNRQLYVMGKDAQARMSASSVLIAGLRGAGVEIAKNLALMGVKSITLADDGLTELSDLSAQFFLCEDDVGKPRAAACAAKLSELNQYVPITVHAGPAIDAIRTGDYAVAVVNDASLDSQLALNAACRETSTAFIATANRGAFASIFNDFGDDFVVYDQNDQPPTVCMVEGITKDEDGIVTVRDEQMHGFSEGTMVTFTEIQGMEELNNKEPIPVTKFKGAYTFAIGDTRKYGDYLRGGYVKEVKQPKTLSFLALKEALSSPEFVYSDFGKMVNCTILHAAFLALDKFTSVKGRLPTPGKAADAEELVGLAKATAAEYGQSVEDDTKFTELVRAVGRCAAGQIGPVSAVLGGIAAQEALKACSGKFTPLKQFMYLDFGEILPEDAPESDFAPTESRYDGQIAVIGRKLQDEILSLKYFLVGAGAIGCEMLKNWAVMGVGCGPTGRVDVTDMDNIEKSNLSRQFLFRPSDIGKAKSVSAVAATKKMNPAFNGHAHEMRVGPDTEGKFNEEFWDNLSGVCTALDNVDARLYVDAHCVQSKKPLLESGTLGTKGNTQIVVPYLTENYGASQDPPEKSIPICTLKNFPNKIEHTLQWARDWFEGVFHNGAENVQSYFTQSDYLAQLERQMNTRVTTLESIHELVVASRPSSTDDCIRWARLKFAKMFNHDIRQLLHTFPKDSTTSEGVPFWSGPKRAPSPVVFDVDDTLHFTFVMSAANMWATVFGLDTTDDVEHVKAVIAATSVPDFVPKGKVKIATTDEEAKKMEQAPGDDSDARAEQYIKDLSSADRVDVTPVDFDKDIDAHMSVVAATSNLRARNYRIEEADKHESRRIAGKIIPAIATTTGLVAGLISIELYKLLQKRPIEAFRNCYANLAISTFVFSEPMGCPKNVLPLPPAADGSERQWEWSLWDSIDVHAPKTLEDLIDFFTDEYGLDVNMITYGSKMLWSMFMNPKKQATRKAGEISEVVAEVMKEPITGVSYIELIVLATAADDEEADLPPIRYFLNGSGAGTMTA